MRISGPAALHASNPDATALRDPGGLWWGGGGGRRGLAAEMHLFRGAWARGPAPSARRTMPAGRVPRRPARPAGMRALGWFTTDPPHERGASIAAAGLGAYTSVRAADTRKHVRTRAAPARFLCSGRPRAQGEGAGAQSCASDWRFRAIHSYRGLPRRLPAAPERCRSCGCAGQLPAHQGWLCAIRTQRSIPRIHFIALSAE